jgi:hypothetical protein
MDNAATVVELVAIPIVFSAGFQRFAPTYSQAWSTLCIALEDKDLSKIVTVGTH